MTRYKLYSRIMSSPFSAEIIGYIDNEPDTYIVDVGAGNPYKVTGQQIRDSGFMVIEPVESSPSVTAQIGATRLNGWGSTWGGNFIQQSKASAKMKNDLYDHLRNIQGPSAHLLKRLRTRTESELRQLFQNRTNCSAWNGEKGMMAIDENQFVEVMKEIGVLCDNS